jgi:hypothetical protein
MNRDYSILGASVSADNIGRYKSRFDVILDSKSEKELDKVTFSEMELDELKSPILNAIAAKLPYTTCMETAIYDNNVDAIVFFMHKYPIPNNALFTAAAANNVPAFKAIFSMVYGPELAANNTPVILKMASIIGNNGCTDILNTLTKGAASTNQIHSLAILEAIRSCKYNELIELLKITGNDLHMYEILELVAANNDLIALKILRDILKVEYILSCMCVFRSTIAVEYLLESGADIHELNDFPLMIVCATANFDILHVLMKYGPNVEARIEDIRAFCNEYTMDIGDVLKLPIYNGADRIMIDPGQASQVYDILQRSVAPMST